MSADISPEREAELLDLLLREIYSMSLKKTLQVYPECECGSHTQIESEYDFHPQKKGILVKVALCVCGRSIFPNVEWVS